MKTLAPRTPAAVPLPTAIHPTDHLVPLGSQATRALATLCRRYRVRPDCVLRAIVEQFLADACADDSLVPCVADEARLIHHSGAVPTDWWHKTELKTPGYGAEANDDQEADLSQPTAPGRIVVELDDLASAMLRLVCREGNQCHEAGEDPRDLVNAAATFFLCSDHNDQHGRFDLNDSGDALARATSDRMARQGKEAA